MRYFKDELHFPLCVDCRLYQGLQKIIVLRDSIAHGNGQRTSIKPEHWKKIERWSKQDTRISVLDDNLTFEEGFLRESCAIVTHSLTDLLKRVRERRDSNNNGPT
jgi:hypothetical protein